MPQKRMFAWQTVATFCVMICLCGLATCFLVNRKYQLEYIKMEQVITQHSNRLQIVLGTLLYKTRVLAALVFDQKGSVRDFDKVASNLLDDPAILNLILAPNGIVSAVYPLKGQESLLGFDFFSDRAGNREAAEARSRGEMVLGGPFDSIQGGKVLVGRLPVYMNDGGKGAGRFWGLVSVTLKFPDALAGADLEHLAAMDLAYEIWRINPDDGKRQVIAHSSGYYNKNAPYLEIPLSILNARWFFRISPIKLWYQYPESWLYICVSVLLALFLAVLVQHNINLREIRQKLEDVAYMDALTGILNRRGLLEAVADLHRESRGYCLFYFDLNKFKKINDTWGHNAGDLTLQEFVRQIQATLSGKYLLGRLGGDEFALVTYGEESGEPVMQKLEQLRQKLRDYRLPGCPKEVRLSFSIGRAAYPGDGDNPDAILQHADSNMYKEKISSRDIPGDIPVHKASIRSARRDV